MTAPAFIALTAAASAYVEARRLQDAAEHLHRIRLLSKAPDSVVRAAAEEWSRATAEASANYHELARCAEVASAAVRAANVPHPAPSRLPLAVEMAHHCRSEELRRQFELECG